MKPARASYILALLLGLVGCESSLLNKIESSSADYYSCESIGIYPHSCTLELSINTEADLRAKKAGISDEKISAANALGKIKGNPHGRMSPYHVLANSLHDHPYRLEYSEENSLPFDKNKCHRSDNATYFNVLAYAVRDGASYFAVRESKGCRSIDEIYKQPTPFPSLTQKQVTELGIRGPLKSAFDSKSSFSTLNLVFSSSTKRYPSVIHVSGDQDPAQELSRHIAAIAEDEKAIWEAAKVADQEARKKSQQEFRELSDAINAADAARREALDAATRKALDLGRRSPLTP